MLITYFGLLSMYVRKASKVIVLLARCLVALSKNKVVNKLIISRYTEVVLIRSLKLLSGHLQKMSLFGIRQM